MEVTIIINIILLLQVVVGYLFYKIGYEGSRKDFEKGDIYCHVNGRKVLTLAHEPGKYTVLVYDTDTVKVITPKA